MKTLFFKPRVVSILLFAIVLLTVAANLIVLNAPWEKGLKGVNGLIHSAQFGVNYLKYGFLTDYLIPRHFTIGDTPWLYYHHPPLLFILVGLCFKFFGIHEWSARIIPFLASTGLLLFIYLWVRKIYTQRIALLTTAVTSILPVFFWYSTEVWFEGCVLFFTYLSLFLYQRYIESPSRGRLIGLTASASMGLLFDWPAYLLIPLLLADYYGIHKKRDFSFLLLPFSALVIYFLTNLHVALVTGDAACTSFYSFFVYQQTSFERVDLLNWMKQQWKDDQQWLTLPVFITAFLYLAFSIIKRRFKEDRWLFGLFLAGVIYMLIFNRHTQEHEFFLVYLAVPFSLAFSLAVCRLSRENKPILIRAGACALFILAAVFCVKEDWSNYRQYFQKPKGNYEWREMRQGKPPTLHRYKTAYYYLVDLTQYDLKEVRKILNRGFEDKKPRNLLLGIFDPRFAETEEEKKKQEAIKSLVESRCERITENLNILLYITAR